MKYRICRFTDFVKWVVDQSGVYWVNPVFLQEFKEVYAEEGGWETDDDKMPEAVVAGSLMRMKRGLSG